MSTSTTTTTTVPLTIKWGKETIELPSFVPAVGVKGMKQELESLTGVPMDRMKLMAKSKGLWKGVLKDDMDLTTIDWKTALVKAGPTSPSLQILLMGSADQPLALAPKEKTLFLEDLPPEMAAKVQEPSGLVNLGNTCYLNSVVQCLRVIQPLRLGLDQYQPGLVPAAASAVSNSSSNMRAALLVSSLRDTLRRMDRQTEALQPVALIQSARMVFPQFAQRGPQGQPMQQDAEEFFSQLMTAVATEIRGIAPIQKALTMSVPPTDQELMGADNLIDALFGIRMKETLTCDELAPTTPAAASATTILPTAAAATTAMRNGSSNTTRDASQADLMLLEPPVISYDLHRKLVCNIQGGSDGAAQANVSHIYEGIALSLNGKIEKHSAALGRDAIWTRAQRIARLPPYLCVQFGRFYWKPTPDSQDHAGVKCKVMKPVAFSSTLDVYDFCSEEIQAVLKISRDKALAAEEDRINKKLKGAVGDSTGTTKPAAVPAIDNAAATTSTIGAAADAAGASEQQDVSMTVPDEEMVDGVAEAGEEAAELRAALAMSLEEALPPRPVGPGLPAHFQGHYELFAVVTHKGRDADGGHYMAWVKAGGSNHSNSGQQQVRRIADAEDDNEDWYVFDDDEVSPCKTEDVLKLKGGGDWHMSYLNFYRAKK